jgi:hypothetical protein
VTGLLAWELSVLIDGTPPDGRAGDVLPSLLSRYLQLPGRGRRVRDWAKALLGPLPAPLPIAHARIPRLALMSTPRALLHVAGALAYLALTGRAGTDVVDEQLARTLPIRRAARPRDPAAQRRAIVALWTWCVRNS